VVQALVPAADVNNAVGFMSVGQDLGIVVILAIAGSVYQNSALKNILPVIPDPTRDRAFNVMAGTSNPVFDALADSVKTEVIRQIVKAMSGVWALMIGTTALSFVLSFFLGVSLSVGFLGGFILIIDLRERNCTWKVGQHQLKVGFEARLRMGEEFPEELSSLGSRKYAVGFGWLSFKMTRLWFSPL
jgi:hypothetical protein